MMKLNLRGAALLGGIALFVYACGGSSFSSGGGTAAGAGGTAGTANGGGSSVAGRASGGTSSAGTESGGAAGEGEAGASEGGSSAAGTASGGSAHGGTSSAGMSNGGTSSGGKGGTSSAGAAGKAGSGGSGGASVVNSGDCDTDMDCTTGKCEALYPGGFRTCVTPVTQETTCSPACTAGYSCVQTPLGPSCGLVTRPTIECAKEACTTAADCTGNNAICVPGGALDRKVSTCLTGGCRLDADCKDEKGGKCEPVTTNCCSGPSGLYCVYPTTGCRSNADCASGTCQIVDSKNGECVTGSSICAG